MISKKHKLFTLIQTLIILFALYFSIAEVAFAFNNPTANRIQSLVHFKSVLTFETLEQFQGNQGN
jgi:hypothetical protein